MIVVEINGQEYPGVNTGEVHKNCGHAILAIFADSALGAYQVCRGCGVWRNGYSKWKGHAPLRKRRVRTPAELRGKTL
jgi:hypothetical protein